MNKHFKFILASAAIVAGLAGAVSCQDLKGELESLTTKVNALDTQVATLQQAFNAGKLITSVEQVSGTPGGIKINFSDGSSQTINNGNNGKDGKDGAAGADADVWTIVDGYWAKNGVPTEWKAVGTDGTNGTNGTNGTDGADGKDGADGADGCYYVPNAETGCFDKYTPNADGEPTVEPTDISFVPAIEGIVAGVYSEVDGKLYLVIDGDIYELDAFAELKSLVTIPHAYYEGAEAVIYRHMQYQPLVWGNEKNHVAATISDEYMVGETVDAVPVINDIYPLMTVEYYVNPENADLSAITLADLNEGIKLESDLPYIMTRTASNGLHIEAVGFEIYNEDRDDYLYHLGHRVLQVKYLVSGDAAVVDGFILNNQTVVSEISAFALSVPTGAGSENGWVSSDYVALYKQDLNSLRIVDPTKVVSKKFAYNAAGLTPTRNYAPDDVYDGILGKSKDEHYRRAIYGMNFQQELTNNEDPDAWIVNRTNFIPAATLAAGYPTLVAADVKKPNYRDADRNNVHFSADTVVVYTNRTFDLMDIVAAHNFVEDDDPATPALLPVTASAVTLGQCSFNDLSDAALKDLGLEWRFEVVENYYAGLNLEPLTPQEKFVSLNEFGNLIVDEVEPGEGEVLFLPRNYTIDGPSVASIGRHPVIRVSLIDANDYNKNGDGTKPVVESAYIKILIVDTDPEPEAADYDYDFHVLGSEGTWADPNFTQAIPITTYPNPIGFTCVNGFNGTTTVQWTNENIYHDNGDKIIFHNTHVFNPLNAADPVTGYDPATGIDGTLAAGAAWPGHVDFDPAHPFNAAGELVGDLGTVWEVVLPAATSGTTHIINWQISPDDIWSIASVIDEPLEVIRYCKYVGASTITIALHVTIAPFSTVFPLDYENGRNDYFENYWIAHKHNVSEPQWGATAHHTMTPAVGDDNPANCTFENDINASFVTNMGTDPNYPLGSLRVVNDDNVAAYDVEYFFCEDNNVSGVLAAGSYPGVTFQNVRAGEDEHKMENIHIRVSTADLAIPGVGNYPAKQVLYAYQGVLTAEQAALTPEAAIVAGVDYVPVAVITNTPYAGNVMPFNVLRYLEFKADGAARNELALDLLNTNAFYAYLGAKGKICAAPSDHEIQISFHGEDCFKVDFLRPVTIDPAATKHFVDAVDFGQPGSFLRYEDIVSPYDWRYTWSEFNPAYDTHFSNFDNYWQYYGVAVAPAVNDFVIHADVAAAQVNLGPGKSFVDVPGTIVLMANEMVTNLFPLKSWDGPDGIAATADDLDPANDKDWLTDVPAADAALVPALAAGEVAIYSYNKTTDTPLVYRFDGTLPANADKLTNYGWLTYNTNGVSVGAFTLKIPMEVYYKWGKLRTTVTVEVATTI